MANTDFKDLRFFQKNTKYHLLPFRFKRFGSEYLLTNIVGEYLFLNPKDFHNLCNNQLNSSSPAYNLLLHKHFIYVDGYSAQLDALATKYWTKKSFIQGVAIHRAHIVKLLGKILILAIILICQKKLHEKQRN